MVAQRYALFERFCAFIWSWVPLTVIVMCAFMCLFSQYSYFCNTEHLWALILGLRPKLHTTILNSMSPQHWFHFYLGILLSVHYVFGDLNSPRMCSLARRTHSQLTVEEEYSTTHVTKCSLFFFFFFLTRVWKISRPAALSNYFHRLKRILIKGQ